MAVAARPKASLALSLALCCLLLAARGLDAAQLMWCGGTTALKNFHDSNNWAGVLTACGLMGIPGTADTVDFNGAANVYFNAPITVARMYMFAGVTIATTHPTAGITVSGAIEEITGTVSFTLNGGTFSATSIAMQDTGNLIIQTKNTVSFADIQDNGAGSLTLTPTGSFTMSNTGTVIPETIVITASPYTVTWNMNNQVLKPDTSCTIRTASTVRFIGSGTCKIQGNYILAGGNLVIGSGCTLDGGPTVTTVTGQGSVGFEGGSSYSPANARIATTVTIAAPPVGQTMTIDSTSGAVAFSTFAGWGGTVNFVSGAANPITLGAVTVVSASAILNAQSVPLNGSTIVLSGAGSTLTLTSPLVVRQRLDVIATASGQTLAMAGNGVSVPTGAVLALGGTGANAATPLTVTGSATNIVGSGSPALLLNSVTISTAQVSFSTFASVSGPVSGGTTALTVASATSLTLAPASWVGSLTTAGTAVLSLTHAAATAGSLTVGGSSGVSLSGATVSGPVTLNTATGATALTINSGAVTGAVTVSQAATITATTTGLNAASLAVGAATTVSGTAVGLGTVSGTAALSVTATSLTAAGFSGSVALTLALSGATTTVASAVTLGSLTLNGAVLSVTGANSVVSAGACTVSTNGGQILTPGTGSITCASTSVSGTATIAATASTVALGAVTGAATGLLTLRGTTLTAASIASINDLTLTGALTVSTGAVALGNALALVGGSVTVSTAGLGIAVTGACSTATSASALTTTGAGTLSCGSWANAAPATLAIGGSATLRAVSGTGALSVTAASASSTGFTGNVNLTLALAGNSLTVSGAMTVGSLALTNAKVAVSGAGNNFVSQTTCVVNAGTGSQITAASGSVQCFGTTVTAGGAVTIASTTSSVSLGPLAVAGATVVQASTSATLHAVTGSTTLSISAASAQVVSITSTLGLTLALSGATLSLATPVTVASLTLTGATLSVAGANSVTSTGACTFTGAGGSILTTGTGAIVCAGVAANGPTTLTASGSTVTTGAVTANAATALSGTALTLAAVTGTSSLSLTFSGAGSTATSIAVGGALTVAGSGQTLAVQTGGAVSAASLALTAANLYILGGSGAFTFTGACTVSAGLLNNFVGTGAIACGSTTVNGASRLETTGAIGLGVLSGSAALVVNGTAATLTSASGSVGLTLALAGATVAVSGGAVSVASLTLNNAVLSVGGANNFAASGACTVAAGGGQILTPATGNILCGSTSLQGPATIAASGVSSTVGLGPVTGSGVTLIVRGWAVATSVTGVNTLRTSGSFGVAMGPLALSGTLGLEGSALSLAVNQPLTVTGACSASVGASSITTSGTGTVVCGGWADGAAATISSAAAVTLGALSGSGSLSVTSSQLSMTGATGSVALTLAQNGATTSVAGAVSLASLTLNAASFSVTGSSSLAVAGACTLSAAGGTIAAPGTGAIGCGSLVTNGPTTVSAAGGSVNLGTGLTCSGSTTISAGQSVALGTVTGSSPLSVTAASATLAGVSGTIPLSIALPTSTVLAVTGATTVASLTLSGVTFRDGASITSTGACTLNAGSSLALTDTGTVQCGSVSANAATSITAAGASAFTLGTVSLSPAAPLTLTTGSTIAVTSLSGASALTAAGTLTVASGGLSLSSLTLNGASVTLSAANQPVTVTGACTANAGAVADAITTSGAAGAVSCGSWANNAPATITTAAAVALGAVTGTSSLSVTGSAATVTGVTGGNIGLSLALSGGTLAVSSAMSVASLTLTGTTVRVSGANNFQSSGLCTINGGAIQSVDTGSIACGGLTTSGTAAVTASGAGVTLGNVNAASGSTTITANGAVGMGTVSGAAALAITGNSATATAVTGTTALSLALASSTLSVASLAAASLTLTGASVTATTGVTVANACTFNAPASNINGGTAVTCSSTAVNTPALLSATSSITTGPLTGSSSLGATSGGALTIAGASGSVALSVAASSTVTCSAPMTVASFAITDSTAQVDGAFTSSGACTFLGSAAGLQANGAVSCGGATLNAAATITGTGAMTLGAVTASNQPLTLRASTVAATSLSGLQGLTLQASTALTVASGGLAVPNALYLADSSITLSSADQAIAAGSIACASGSCALTTSGAGGDVTCNGAWTVNGATTVTTAAQLTCGTVTGSSALSLTGRGASFTALNAPALPLTMALSGATVDVVGPVNVATLSLADTSLQVTGSAGFTSTGAVTIAGTTGGALVVAGAGAVTVGGALTVSAPATVTSATGNVAVQSLAANAATAINAAAGTITVTNAVTGASGVPLALTATGATVGSLACSNDVRLALSGSTLSVASPTTVGSLALDSTTLVVTGAQNFASAGTCSFSGSSPKLTHAGSGTIACGGVALNAAAATIELGTGGSATLGPVSGGTNALTINGASAATAVTATTVSGLSDLLLTNVNFGCASDLALTGDLRLTASRVVPTGTSGVAVTGTIYAAGASAVAPVNGAVTAAALQSASGATAVVSGSTVTIGPVTGPGSVDLQATTGTLTVADLTTADPALLAGTVTVTGRIAVPNLALTGATVTVNGAAGATVDTLLDVRGSSPSSVTVAGAAGTLSAGSVQSTAGAAQATFTAGTFQTTSIALGATNAVTVSAGVSAALGTVSSAAGGSLVVTAPAASCAAISGSPDVTLALSGATLSVAGAVAIDDLTLVNTQLVMTTAAFAANSVTTTNAGPSSITGAAAAALTLGALTTNGATTITGNQATATSVTVAAPTVFVDSGAVTLGTVSGTAATSLSVTASLGATVTAINAANLDVSLALNGQTFAPTNGVVARSLSLDDTDLTLTGANTLALSGALTSVRGTNVVAIPQMTTPTTVGALTVDAGTLQFNVPNGVAVTGQTTLGAATTLSTVAAAAQLSLNGGASLGAGVTLSTTATGTSTIAFAVSPSLLGDVAVTAAPGGVLQITGADFGVDSGLTATVSGEVKWDTLKAGAGGGAGRLVLAADALLHTQSLPLQLVGPAPGSATLDLTASVTLASLTMPNGAPAGTLHVQSQTGANLEVTGALTLGSGGPVLDLQDSVNLAVDGAVRTEANSLIQLSGGSDLTLIGAGTIAGGIHAAGAASINLGPDDLTVLGDLRSDSAAVTVAGTGAHVEGTLRAVSPGSITVTSGVTLSGALAGDGAITMTGAVLAPFESAAYTGALTLNAVVVNTTFGAVHIPAADLTGTMSVTGLNGVSFANARFTNGGAIDASDPTTLSGLINVGASQTLSIPQATSVTTGQSLTVLATSPAGTLALAAPLTVPATSTLTLGGANALTVTGASGSLVGGAGSTLALAGTRIADSVFFGASATSPFETITGPASGNTLELSVSAPPRTLEFDLPVAGVVSVTGTSALTLNVPAGVTHTGTFTFADANSLAVTGAGVVAGSIALNNGGGVAVSGTAAVTGPVSVAGAPATLAVTSPATFAAAVTSTQSLTVNAGAGATFAGSIASAVGSPTTTLTMSGTGTVSAALALSNAAPIVVMTDAGHFTGPVALPTAGTNLDLTLNPAGANFGGSVTCTTTCQVTESGTGQVSSAITPGGTPFTYTFNGGDFQGSINAGANVVNLVIANGQTMDGSIVTSADVHVVGASPTAKSTTDIVFTGSATLFVDGGSFSSPAVVEVGSNSLTLNPNSGAVIDAEFVRAGTGAIDSVSNPRGGSFGPNYLAVTAEPFATANDGAWNTLGTWSTNVVPTTYGDVTINHVVTTNPGPTTIFIRSLTIGAGGSLTMNALDVQLGLTIAGAATLGGAITVHGTASVTGAGPVRVSAVSAVTLLNGGTLSALFNGDDAATSVVALGGTGKTYAVSGLTTGSGANALTFSVPNAASVTWNVAPSNALFRGVSVGAGSTLALVGAATFTADALTTTPTSTVTLDGVGVSVTTGPNTLAGSLTVVNAVQPVSILPSGQTTINTFVVTANVAPLQLSLGGTVAAPDTLTIAGSQTVTLASPIAVLGAVVLGANAKIGGSASFTGAGEVRLSSGFTSPVGSAALDVNVVGPASGTATITQSAPVTVRNVGFVNPATSTGVLAIAGAFAFTTGTVTLGAGATITVAAGSLTIPAATLSGTITTTGATGTSITGSVPSGANFRLNNNGGAAATVAGAFALAGTMTLGGTQPITSTSAQWTGAGTLQLNAGTQLTFASASPVNLRAPTTGVATLTVPAARTFASVVYPSSQGSIVFTGAGPLTLASLALVSGGTFTSNVAATGVTGQATLAGTVAGTGEVSANGPITVSGLTLGASTSLTLNPGANAATVGGQISGSSSALKFASGTLDVSNALFGTGVTYSATGSHTFDVKNVLVALPNYSVGPFTTFLTHSTGNGQLWVSPNALTMAGASVIDTNGVPLIAIGGGNTLAGRIAVSGGNPDVTLAGANCGANDLTFANAGAGSVNLAMTCAVTGTASTIGGTQPVALSGAINVNAANAVLAVTSGVTSSAAFTGTGSLALGAGVTLNVPTAAGLAVDVRGPSTGSSTINLPSGVETVTDSLTLTSPGTVVIGGAASASLRTSGAVSLPSGATLTTAGPSLTTTGSATLAGALTVSGGTPAIVVGGANNVIGQGFALTNNGAGAGASFSFVGGGMAAGTYAVTFGGSSPLTVSGTINPVATGNTIVLGATVTSNAAYFGDGTVQLMPGAVANAAGATTLNVNVLAPTTTGSATINVAPGVSTAVRGLSYTGAGTLVIAGPSTSTLTTAGGGGVTMAAGSTLSTSGGVNLNVAAASTLQGALVASGGGSSTITFGAATVANDATLTVSESGSSTMTLAGSYVLGNGNSRLRVAGPTTTTITATIDGAGTTNLDGGAVVFSGAVLSSTQTAVSGATALSGTATIDAASTLTVSTATQVAAGGTLTLLSNHASTAVLALAQDLTVPANSMLVLGSAANPVTVSGAENIVGSGVLKLSGASVTDTTFLPSTFSRIDGPVASATTTLRLTAPQTIDLGAYEGTLVVVGDFPLTLNVPAAPPAVTGRLTIQGNAAVTLAGPSAAAFTGAITVTDGSVTVAGPTVSSAIAANDNPTPITLTSGAYTGVITAGGASVVALSAAAGQTLGGSLVTSSTAGVTVGGAGRVNTDMTFNAQSSLTVTSGSTFGGDVVIPGGQPFTLNVPTGATVLPTTTIATLSTGDVNVIGSGAFNGVIAKAVNPVSNAAWSTASTWETNAVPGATTDVRLSTFSPAAPTGPQTVRNVYLSGGSSLNFAGQTLTARSLSVEGSVAIAGTVALSAGLQLSVGSTVALAANTAVTAAAGGSFHGQLTGAGAGTSRIVAAGGTFDMSDPSFLPAANVGFVVTGTATFDVGTNQLTLPNLALANGAAFTVASTGSGSLTVGSLTTTGTTSIASGAITANAAALDGAVTLGPNVVFKLTGASTFGAAGAASIAGSSSSVLSLEPTGALVCTSPAVFNAPTNVNGGALSGVCTVGTSPLTVTAASTVGAGNSGVLQLLASAAGSTFAVNAAFLTPASRSLRLGGTTALTVVASGSGSLTGAGATSTLQLTGCNVVAAAFINGQFATLQGPTSGATTTLTITAPRTLTFATFDGTLVTGGAFPLTLAGTGFAGALVVQDSAVTLSGGAFSGPITVNSGSLTLAATVSGDIAFGSQPATVTLSSGSYSGTLRTGPNVVTVNTLSAFGGNLVQSAGGELVLQGTTFLGSIQLNGGANAAGTHLAAGSVTVAGAVSLTAAATISVVTGTAFTQVLSAGSQDLTVNCASGTFASDMASGTGSLTLTGACALTGAVTLGVTSTKPAALVVNGPTVSGPITLGAPNTIAYQSGAITQPILTGSNTLTVAPTAPLTASVTSTGTGGIVIAGSAPASLAIASNGGDKTLTVNSGATFAGSVTNAGGLLTLAAVGTGLLGGTIATASNVAIAAGAGTVNPTIQPSATVTVTNAGAFTGTIVTSNSLSVTSTTPFAGAITQSSANPVTLTGPGTFSGALALGSAPLTLAGNAVAANAITADAATTITIPAGSSLTGSVTTSNPLAITGAGSIGAAARVRLNDPTTIALTGVQIASGARFTGATPALTIAGVTFPTGVLVSDAATVVVTANSTLGAFPLASLALAPGVAVAYDSVMGNATYGSLSLPGTSMLRVLNAVTGKATVQTASLTTDFTGAGATQAPVTLDRVTVDVAGDFAVAVPTGATASLSFVGGGGVQAHSGATVSYPNNNGAGSELVVNVPDTRGGSLSFPGAQGFSFPNANPRGSVTVNACYAADGVGATAGVTVHKPAECNLCAVQTPCQNGGTCSDSFQSFTCHCPTAFTGALCQSTTDECASMPCQNGGTCVDEPNAFRCQCTAGWSGSQCQVNINECASNPCLQGYACTDLLNGFVCDCPAGRTGSVCQTDINECASSPCRNGGSCVDRLNGFTCSCAAGYYGAVCEGYSIASSTGIGEINLPPVEVGTRRVVIYFARELSSVVNLDLFLADLIQYLATTYNFAASRAIVFSVDAVDIQTTENLRARLMALTARLSQAAAAAGGHAKATAPGFRVTIDIRADSTDPTNDPSLNVVTRITEGMQPGTTVSGAATAQVPAQRVCDDGTLSVDCVAAPTPDGGGGSGFWTTGAIIGIAVGAGLVLCLLILLVLICLGCCCFAPPPKRKEGPEYHDGNTPHSVTCIRCGQQTPVRGGSQAIEMQGVFPPPSPGSTKLGPAPTTLPSHYMAGTPVHGGDHTGHAHGHAHGDDGDHTGHSHGGAEVGVAFSPTNLARTGGQPSTVPADALGNSAPGATIQIEPPTASATAAAPGSPSSAAASSPRGVQFQGGGRPLAPPLITGASPAGANAGIQLAVPIAKSPGGNLNSGQRIGGGGGGGGFGTDVPSAAAKSSLSVTIDQPQSSVLTIAPTPTANPNNSLAVPGASPRPAGPAYTPGAGALIGTSAATPRTAAAGGAAPLSTTGIAPTPGANPSPFSSSPLPSPSGFVTPNAGKPTEWRFA